MKCDICHQQEAMVHKYLESVSIDSQVCDDPGEMDLSKLEEEANPPWEEVNPAWDQFMDRKELHLCRECADRLYASTPGMNSCRNLICLSDDFRSRLYDLLEVAHPEAFDYSDDESCERASELMRSFLTEQLAKEKVEVKGDAFEMLLADFLGSHHFYTRADEVQKRRGKSPGSAL